MRGKKDEVYESAVIGAFEEFLTIIFENVMRVVAPGLDGNLTVCYFTAGTTVGFTLDYAKGSRSSELGKVMITSEKVELNNTQTVFDRETNNLLVKKIIPYLRKIFSARNWQVCYVPTQRRGRHLEVS